MPTRQPVIEPIVPLPSDSFVWRRDDYPLPWSVWNSHPECEIHLIRASQGTCFVGDHIGPFAAGDLYLIGPDLPHNWVTPLDLADRIEGRDVVLQFDPDRLRNAAETLPELARCTRLIEAGRRGLIFHGTAREKGAALMEAIGAATELGRLALFLQLLSLLYATDEVTALSSPGFVPKPDERTNRILQTTFRWLTDNLDQDVRLADVAALAGMTETSFSRFFSKTTGNNFGRHLSELRTSKACQLLAETDRPITLICHEVGYVNLSNFNRAFRARRGMTPSSYRRLARA